MTDPSASPPATIRKTPSAMPAAEDASHVARQLYTPAENARPSRTKCEKYPVCSLLSFGGTVNWATFSPELEYILTVGAASGVDGGPDEFVTLNSSGTSSPSRQRVIMARFPQDPVIGHEVDGGDLNKTAENQNRCRTQQSPSSGNPHPINRS